MLRRTANQTSMEIVDPVTDPKWAKLVSNTPSTLFHSPRWMKVLQESYGFSFSACVLEDEGNPVAGIPWCDVNDLFGSRRITLPFSDFCDVLSSNPCQTRILVEHLMGSAKSWTLRSLARNLPDTEMPVHGSTLYKWHGIDLTPSTDTLWKQLSKSVRRGVRKANQQGVTVCKAESKDQLREWFGIHLRLRKTKFGLLVQPYSFFESLWDHFVETGQGFVLLAMYQGKVIAGEMDLIWQNSLFSKFAASNPDYLAVKPNTLLCWTGILEAKEMGCELYDFGRSDTGQDGLLAFKRAFGASEEDLYSVTYHSKDHQSGDGQEARTLIQGLTQLLVNESVPDSVTEEAGELLYHLFA